MIEGEVKRHIRDSGQIRVSRSLRDIAYKAMQAKEKLTSDMKREPTIEEISEIMSLARIGHLKGLCTILNVEGYFDHFKAQYDKMVEEGFISPAERGRIIFLDSLDELKKLM